jgi:signal transduction histidine kinase
VRAWNRLSIAAKLPLSLAALLAVTFGGMTAFAYWQVRQSVQTVASERMARAARQLSDLLTLSARQRSTLLQELAARPEVRAAAANPAGAPPPDLTPSLTAYLGTGANASIDVLDASLRRVAGAGATLPALAKAPELAATAATSTTAIIGPFQHDGSLLTYSVICAIRDGDKPIGYVVDRRRFSNSSAAISLLTGLIGSDARLLIGNQSGDVWTDLSTAVPGPPVQPADFAADKLLVYTRDNGEAVIARGSAIGDTPWGVVVEFPRAPVLAPASQFLKAAIAASVVLIVLGAGLGWALSRRITRPLIAVTEAAEAIAAGKPANPLTVKRADEIGRLSVSFNAMSAQVAYSRRQLEDMVGTLETRVNERTAALATANRELEAFSYSVSHDLRAPLRAIDGFARILVEDHGAELSPGARQHLEVIARRTTHMGQLIDDLLAFSRLGRQPLSRMAIDMTALARQVVDEARRADPSRRVEIAIADLPPAVAERALVRQVLQNLIQNALKFTRTRADARIDVGATTDAGGQAAYFVRDNGVGFDMQYADKLFGVFQRLHRSEDFEGTGVGLAIVQRIVHKHGGRTWADAAVDRGATFYFTLPQETVAG